MNILLIYDSAFGNTEHLAHTIASALETYGTVHSVPAHETSKIETQNIDLLILGCPTQSHGLTPAIHALLEDLPRGSLQSVAAATFDTRYQKATSVTGSAAQTMEKALSKAGARLLVPAKSFFIASREGPLVAGELDNAVNWIHTLMERFKTNFTSSLTTHTQP